MNGRVVAVNLTIEIDCWILINPYNLADAGDLRENKTQFFKITLVQLQDADGIDICYHMMNCHTCKIGYKRCKYTLSDF
jgi:hypothetical protein